MKRFTLVFLLALPLRPVLGQDSSQYPSGFRNGQRLESIKIAYLTRRLELSPAEAQKFWPVYNEYIRETRDLRISHRQNKKTVVEAEEELLELKKKYGQVFSKVLTPAKTDSFFRAEKEFNGFILRELQQRRQQGAPQRRGPARPYSPS